MKQIKHQSKRFTGGVALCSALFLLTSAKAETQLVDFDGGFFFDSDYASWVGSPVGGPSNWTITATDFGGAATLFYEEDDFTPRIVNASADDLVEFKLTLEGTNVMGPQLLLEDADGTRLRYSWYGLSSGSHTLVNELAAGNIDGGNLGATGSVAGLDLTNLVLYHVQLDDGAGANTYTLTLENLRTLPFPPPSCESLVSDFDNAGLSGGYAGWSGVDFSGQPDNWTVTATGFGGGWTGISPNIDATGDTTLELVLTVDNINDDNPGLIESIGSTVVLQDGDGTQNTWGFFGLTNGTSHVLTDLLSNGNPVAAQPGTVPGFDPSDISFFHLQVDDGASNWTYTVTFENLKITGFNPTISNFAYDSVASEVDLIWNSRPDRTYSVSYVSDLTGAFSVLESNILSGGVSTSSTVAVPAGDTGFLQVSEECE